MPFMNIKPQRYLGLILLGVMGFLSAYLYVILDFNGFRSDVLSYWNDSLRWYAPFSRDHVPAFPLLIAFFRGVTFGIFPPFLLMWILDVTAKAIGTYFVYRVVLSQRDEGVATAASMLFLLWPLVGTIYGVYPVADVTAMMFVVVGVHFLYQGRILWAGGALGAALLAHKAVWPIVGAIVVLEIVMTRRELRLFGPRFLLPLLLPIGTLWIMGSIHHSSLIWPLERSIDVAAIASGAPPVVKTVTVHTNTEGVPQVLRMIAIWGTVLLCLVVGGVSLLNRDSRLRAISLSIPIGLLLLFVVTNEKTLWAVVRFSPLLAISLGGVCPRRWCERPDGTMRTRLLIPLAGLLLASQFAFAWYMANVYFG